jgi:hypothetical protein
MKEGWKWGRDVDPLSRRTQLAKRRATNGVPPSRAAAKSVFAHWFGDAGLRRYLPCCSL